MVRGCAVQAHRPREHLNTKFFVGQYVGKASEESTIHAGRYEIVDNIPIPGQNGQPYLHANSFRQIIRERLIALHLSENILLGDEADQEGPFVPRLNLGFFGRYRFGTLTTCGNHKDQQKAESNDQFVHRSTPIS